ncbi:MAG: UDP-3-O-acyl-N-acetylglucosamine deacetylase [Pirellulales bacterium]
MNLKLRPQRTIERSVAVDGYGYWSGRDVHVEFRPAAADTGIVFVRSDLQPQVRIPALHALRIETPRRTTLATGGATVEMVEHIMAALAGLAIDNCEVWVDRPEMPGCDGSSQAFVDALDSAGVVEQDAPRATLVVSDVMRVGCDDSWVEARPAPQGGLSVRYRLDYGSQGPIGKQTLQLAVSPETFRRELASARTFLLQEEADWLRNRGLGCRASMSDLLVFGPEGPIDNTLRFPDECVRHKTLDLIGDLAMCGCDIVGQIVAYRSGHRLNADLVRALLTEGRRSVSWRRTG